MYATLAFSITLLGLFSIFEILKGKQISLIKFHFIARLFLITAGSFFDYLELTGNEIPYYHEIFKLIGSLLFVNMLFLIVVKKIPKLVIGLEIFFTLYFIIQSANGFRLPNINDGMLQNRPTSYHFILIGTYFLLLLSAIFYNVFKLSTSKNFRTNLYESKIKRWVLGYMISLLVLFFFNLLLYTSLVRDTFALYNDSMATTFIHRFIFLLFVLFRPKFLDDDKYSISFNHMLSRTKGLAFKEFEFLFYANHYYLQPNANMEDLALKLNVTKNELSVFLRDEIEENFTELLNKNRVEYFKELINAKKYESFTIEALSEMAGFNNRRTMYNAFNKYVGQTPTEFIQSLK